MLFPPFNVNLDFSAYEIHTLSVEWADGEISTDSRVAFFEGGYALTARILPYFSCAFNAAYAAKLFGELKRFVRDILVVIF